jgi:signal recognition particle subunit SRP72
LQYDTEKARKLSSKLPALPPAGYLDLDAIESPNYLASLKNIKRGTKGDSETPTPKETKPEAPTTPFLKPKKKKKKNKPVKDFDPEKVPDPERWLPRYERTGYKTKKPRSKTRGQAQDVVGKGTQGVSSEASAV